MNTRRLVGLISLLIWITSQVYAYEERNLLQKCISPDKIGSSLLMNQQWVSLPEYTDRAGWDTLLGNYKDKMITNGEKYLDYEWKTLTATSYLEYDRSGNRNSMQKPNSANNRALSALVMAELAEGGGRFTDQIVNGVFYTCERTSWVLSAHLGPAQLSKRTLPDYNDHVIDLASGEMGALLSWIHYFFHREFDKITPQIADRMRYEIRRRILEPYMQTDRFWWMAFNYTPGILVNNWNPWCNFNVLQCFLLMENDPKKLAEAVYRTMISTDKFINYTHADGACEEGPSYWGHAAGKLYDYLQLLSEGTGGKVDIFSVPMIKKMGEYIARSYVGNGWVVNFADASARGGGEPSLIYRYGKSVGSEQMMHYAAFLNRQSEEDLLLNSVISFDTDIFRTLQTFLVKKELEQTAPSFRNPTYSWYPETEFCYMTNPNGFFVAMKGGHNNESHNHNDVGTFSLYLNTIPVLIDAGVGTYTRQTFGPERYSIWTMQSDYHNLPAINGVSEKNGSQYKARNTRFDPKQMHFSVDISAAYPTEAAVKKWVRSYKLEKKQLKIEDSFTLEQTKQPNRIHFLTWGETDITVPGEITIGVKGEKIRLEYDKHTFIAEKETLKLTDPRLTKVWGETLFRIVLRARKEQLSGQYRYIITTLRK